MLLSRITDIRNEAPQFLHVLVVVCIGFQRLCVIALLLWVPVRMFVVVLKQVIPFPMVLLGFYFLFQDIRCT